MVLAQFVPFGNYSLSLAECGSYFSGNWASLWHAASLMAAIGKTAPIVSNKICNYEQFKSY